MDLVHNEMFLTYVCGANDFAVVTLEEGIALGRDLNVIFTASKLNAAGGGVG